MPSGASLVVVPFLLGGGVHAESDVPARVRAVTAQRRVPRDHIELLEPMGGQPALSEILEHVVREACSDRVLTGARP